MFLNAKLWAALAFIVSIAASPLNKRGSSVIIGYRTISAGQAAIYKNAGNTLVWSESQSSDQLGEGVYVSPHIGDWHVASTNWDCAILVDSHAWNLVNKAWVPVSDGCTPLWWTKGAPNRPVYLTALGGSSFTPSNTVLLSQIEGFQLLQLLIPPQLLGPSGGLNINVQCAAKTDTAGIVAISVYGDVDWSSWTNVKGTIQTV